MLHKCRATFSTNKLKSLYNNCNGIKSIFQRIKSISALVRQGLCQKKSTEMADFQLNVFFYWNTASSASKSNDPLDTWNGPVSTSLASISI